MRRTVITVIAGLLGLLALGVAPALGDAPQFHSANSSVDSNGAFVVSFDERGLGNGDVTYSLTANSTATWACLNGGGKNPSASNKRSFTTTVRKSGTFSADRNGNVVGSETLSPPSAASLGFSCPSGQQTTFVSVSYSNLTVKDTTSGAGTTFSGTFSYTNPAAPAVR
jgi:hypothetical protein